MKVCKILSPSQILCDKESGTIKIQAIDGATLLFSGIDFNNWESKFDTIFVSDGKAVMSKIHDTNPNISTFFSNLTNLIYGSIKEIGPIEMEDRCDEILNVVSQHIKGDVNGANIR